MLVRPTTKRLCERGMEMLQAFSACAQNLRLAADARGLGNACAQNLWPAAGRALSMQWYRLSLTCVMGLLWASAAFAQNTEQSEPVRIFYDTRAVTGHSTELSKAGQMKFIIGHRFGTLGSGPYELFGLDQSTIRIGLDYGVRDWLNVGLGRSSLGKTVDGFAKVGVLRQRGGGSPVAVTLLASVAANGLRFRDTTRENYFSHRLAYVYQAHVARRIGDRLSVMLSPTLTHRNLVKSDSISHDAISVGGTVRYLLAKRVTFTGQYFYVLQGQLEDNFTESLGVGIDLETKGHVFQFFLGNARGMTESLFITETTGSWLDGDIHLGFNITRDFQVGAKKQR